MRSIDEIKDLLDELEHRCAHELEDQDLDFKEWNLRSRGDSVALVVEMAICMANGGGGTVVFGVNDKAIGRSDAILGVPPEIDVNLLKKAVYDSTDPRLTPVFEELFVSEGSGRLLIMQVHPGLPPYTDTQGRGKVRVGTDCQPLTGTLRRRIMVETGEGDFTAGEVPGDIVGHLSAAAMEELREIARRERAPDELLSLSDVDLLITLELVTSAGRLTRAGLLLAGKDSSIKEHLPGYSWTYLRMRSDTNYADRADGRLALPIALGKVLDRIMADNPITTITQGMFHFEYRIYPEVALREALMNAFCHADFHQASPILVKQFPDHLEITNPGSFIGGVTPENILHHRPVARNPKLVEALTRLRLVNRSNMGVPRMFKALLIEGKEPPIIHNLGEAVMVAFLARDISAPFRLFVAEEDQKGRPLGVDHLLILQYLLHHREIDTSTAARICQRKDAQARETLSQMETQFGYLERGGGVRTAYWSLSVPVHERLAAPGHPERDRRIDWEAAKMRVLSILKQRMERGEPGLSNSDIRQITRFDRNRALRLMQELMLENPQISRVGARRHSRYVFNA